jgi:hypothetical protein
LWPRSSKKRRNASRISAPVRGAAVFDVGMGAGR